jgi:hypothetical protein
MANVKKFLQTDRQAKKKKNKKKQKNKQTRRTGQKLYAPNLSIQGHKKCQSAIDL